MDQISLIDAQIVVVLEAPFSPQAKDVRANSKGSVTSFDNNSEKQISWKFA